MNIAQLNRALECGQTFLDEKIWQEWLWETDLHAPLCPLFNRSHLLGLLIARHRALHQPCDVRLGECLPNIVHASKRTCDLTLRQLRDAIEDVQMHWEEHCKHGDGVVDVLDALWVRFGTLNLCPQVGLDDLASVDPENPTRMSNATIRRFTALFCVLYRHLDLEDRCECIECPFDFEIEKFHVQAGLDTFYEHAMYADIPPASRITYKQDFAGMYHSITQVVYFHYPDYARKRQVSLEQIVAGTSHLHCLSVALELRPDIPVKMEDDLWAKGWNWSLLSGGKLYLVSPTRRIYTATKIWSLLGRVSVEDT
jgi:hypothetical protein